VRVVVHEYFFTIVIPQRSSIAREESAVLPAEADSSPIDRLGMTIG
jgi:hypothetical protein